MATLRQLAASLSDSEKGLYTESPYPNRDQEIAGITRQMKQLAMEHQPLLIVCSSVNDYFCVQFPFHLRSPEFKHCCGKPG